MKIIFSYLFFLWIGMLFHCRIIQAQDIKNEVESSISRNQMPVAALSLLNRFWKDAKKADYYRELNNNKISFEAKIFWKDDQYSIEFDEEGSLQDIEQLIKFDEIPETLRNTITKEIKKQYPSFGVNRVQRQFSKRQPDNSDSEVVQKLFKHNFNDLLIRYELEINAENKEELGTFEVLFDENGKLLQKRKIVRRSLDNIW